MQLTLTREPSLRERVATELIRLIALDQLHPGEVVTEKRVAEIFGVSRTPAREALLKLADTGILAPGPKAAFVIAHTTAQDAGWLYDCIISIEQLAVRSLRTHTSTPAPASEALDTEGEGKGIGGYDLGDLEKALKHTQAVASDDLFEYWRADKEFHTALVGLAGNPHLVALANYARAGLSRYITMYLTRERASTHSVTEHSGIVEALQAGELDAAEQRLTDHWNSARELVTSALEEKEARPRNEAANLIWDGEPRFGYGEAR